MNVMSFHQINFISDTIINNGSVSAENISLLVNVLYYQLPTKSQNHTERSMNLTLELDRLEVSESSANHFNLQIPGGKPWHHSVDFIVYVDGVKTDYR